MQTPDNARGRLTDFHMYKWRQEHPEVDSSTYNREWEAYYKSMTEEEAVEIEKIRNKLYGSVLQDDGFYTDSTLSEYYQKKKEADWKNYYKKNRTKKQKQTKGAFGKCKFGKK